MRATSWFVVITNALACAINAWVAAHSTGATQVVWIFAAAMWAVSTVVWWNVGRTIRSRR